MSCNRLLIPRAHIRPTLMSDIDEGLSLARGVTAGAAATIEALAAPDDSHNDCSPHGDWNVATNEFSQVCAGKVDA
jgi:hypothetical protein